MLLTLHITKEELFAFLERLMPFRVNLHQEESSPRWVELGAPKDLILIARQGLHMSTHGQLRYTALGVPITLQISHIEILLNPEVIENSLGQKVLSASVRIEQLALDSIPGMLEREIQKRVNAALDEASSYLQWAFIESLSRVFRAHSRLELIEEFSIRVEDGNVTVESEYMNLSVNGKLDIHRGH